MGYLLFMLFVRREYKPFSAIPYGPYLVAGGWIMLWYGAEVLRWYTGT